MQRALGVGDSEDLEEHELLEAIARRGGTLVVLRVWGSSVSAPLLAVCRRDGTLVSASKNGPPRMTATSLSDELKSDAEAVAVFEAASDSLYLPLSPCISLYLPVSPCISLYLPLAAREVPGDRGGRAAHQPLRPLLRHGLRVRRRPLPLGAS